MFATCEESRTQVFGTNYGASKYVLRCKQGWNPEIKFVLDSGSGTNWITRNVLNRLKHTSGLPPSGKKSGKFEKSGKSQGIFIKFWKSGNFM